MSVFLKYATFLSKTKPTNETELIEEVRESVTENAKEKLEDTAKVKGEAALGDKVVALLFSASWCPPCQHFLPLLRQVYQDLATRHSELEVVFVSLDRTQDEMTQYYHNQHADWLALPYDDPLKDVLIEKYGISLIPKLVVIAPDGEVITARGRRDVTDKGLISFRTWHAANMAAITKMAAAENQKQQEGGEDGMEGADR